MNVNERDNEAYSMKSSVDKATACQMLAKESHNKSLAQTMNPSKRYLKLGIISVEIILTYFRKLLSSAFK